MMTPTSILIHYTAFEKNYSVVVDCHFTPLVPPFINQCKHNDLYLFCPFSLMEVKILHQLPMMSIYGCYKKEIGKNKSCYHMYL